MIRFNPFVYCTMGRRAELERGMQGKNPALFRRMLDEIAAYVRFADDAGYAGWGHPEHHLQIEGFEAANDPTLMGMWVGQHSKRLRVITCGFVSTVHNPLRTAEAIATMDNMLDGRFGVGLVRGYQTRWVDNFRVKDDVAAVGPWNKDSDADVANRAYFAEYVDIVVKALTHDTFSHHGRYWQFPPPDLRNPHVHEVYTRFGQGVDADMHIREVGIAPRPLQSPHPPLYGGFSASMRTARFWARYRGKPIVMSDNIDFLAALWAAYREEAARHDYSPAPGDEAAWGGLMICAESDSAAEALAADFRWFWETWAMPFGQPYPELLFGSPDTLSRRIDEVASRVPINEMFLIIPQGLHERDDILRSLDLFANRVMPNFA
ncbi:MAG: LLM class flavin-dependent oxidoreductase [Gammaproteobacteria bacterium]|nr:LLM class flavin-dependent oxidoreductase [Gammaproteobacteria bacterium]MCP5202102.1 LLM class flavin-dependent oxidoreductase [Gammaproteobacteria bacterium]